MMKHGTGGWVAAFTFGRRRSLAAVECPQVPRYGVKGFRPECFRVGDLR